VNDYDERHRYTPLPQGELALQTIAMPRDTNASGDIFGGWLLSQMDLAGAITAAKWPAARVATVAIEGMAFITPCMWARSCPATAT
jgi:acyl-CoA thioesterase YciA